MKRSRLGLGPAIQMSVVLALMLAGCEAREPSDAEVVARFHAARPDLEKLIVTEHAYWSFRDSLSSRRLRATKEDLATWRTRRQELRARLGLPSGVWRFPDSVCRIPVWRIKDWGERGFIYSPGPVNDSIPGLFDQAMAENIHWSQLEGRWYVYRFSSP